MKAEFLFIEDDILYTTYNGISLGRFSDCTEYDFKHVLKPKFERKFGVVLISNKGYINLFYKFDVERQGSEIILYVDLGTFDLSVNDIEWDHVYTAKASPNYVGVKEEGEGNLDYWYKYFMCCCNTVSKPKIGCVNLFERSDTMRTVRQVFNLDLSNNIFEFMFKQSLKRKKQVLTVMHNKELFDNMPVPYFNKRIGNQYNSVLHDDHIIHYAWQREVELNGDVFLDVLVISGMVINGMMDVDYKHRFFLSKDFEYSPDGGDISIFSSPYIMGKCRFKKFLMPDRYTGKYMYAYMFSRYYLPVFEILAKAGYSAMADLVFEAYNEDLQLSCQFDLALSEAINLYGRNDREIFGFRLMYFKFVTPEVIALYRKNSAISALYSIIGLIRRIISVDASLFKLDLDYNTICFIDNLIRCDIREGIMAKVRYLLRIGTDNYKIYSDYLHMLKLYGNEVRGHGTYPLNLQVAHDAVVIQVNNVVNFKKDTNITRALHTAKYQKRIYEPECGEYCILAPRNAEDVLQEGKKLSHCVGTYLDQIRDGLSYIYFLRKQAKKSAPLVTIEVSPDNVVLQARGKCNRNLDVDELNFLEEWEKAYGLKDNRI